MRSCYYWGVNQVGSLTFLEGDALARYHQLLNLLGTGCLLVLLAACSSFGSASPAVTSKKFAALKPTPAALPLGMTFYTYHGHSSPVFGVAWARDVKRIASTVLGGSVLVWVDATGMHSLCSLWTTGPLLSRD